MPVLKQFQTTPAMREAIVLDLGDIGAQAARIRAAAETQAQQIITKARATAEQVAKQRGDEAEQRGYNDGLERGLAEGREQGRAEALAQSAEQLRQITAAWSQVATDWEQQRTEMEREARQAVLEFALRTAEKVVHRVIEVDESVVVDQAAQALSMVLSAHDASVRIHPVDRPMLEDALPDLLNELATLEHIDVAEDETITPGGCVVAFGQGRVDARIETQIQRLVDLILPEPPRPPDSDFDDEPGPEPPPTPPGTAAARSTQHEAGQQQADPPQATTRDPALIAPVYEVTDRGLVETHARDGVDEAADTEVPIDPIADAQPANESTNGDAPDEQAKPGNEA
ncbi:MAG: FliH/SctL family protein [Phycisphaeraceae bacterium]